MPLPRLQQQLRKTHVPSPDEGAAVNEYSFVQVTEGRWPSGREQIIGILTSDPAQLAEVNHIEFSPGSDDLDTFLQAALRLPSGRPVLLMRYSKMPTTGTLVLADSLDDPAEARRELLLILHQSLHGFSWTPD